jgi:pimeloyl-ACP methyl ester carboxylesterase
MRKLGVIVGSVALVLGLASPVVRADDVPGDRVPPEQDNGKLGKDDSNGGPPPFTACSKAATTPGGSRLVRPLPAGPTAEDGTFLFTTGVCIYLPPGYDAATTRYPVLYLLHGGGGDAADWINFGSLQETVDAAGGNLIVVMPDGSDGLWYDSPDGSLKNETYVIDHLIPWIDRHLRTIPSRSGRAVSGLSNGGLGAMVLAAKHPDLFVAATSMSGNLGGYLHEYDQLNRPMYHDGNTPTPLASNLDDIALMVRWGATCDPMGDLQEDLCASWGFEQFFRYDNQLFHSTLDELGTEHVYEEVEGSHAWRWWSSWLEEHDLPFLLGHLDDPYPVDHVPVSPSVGIPWTYKSISSSFDIYGYEVDVERATEEFLELDNTVSPMTVTGSGVVTVRQVSTGRVVVVDLADGSTKPIVFD